MQAARSVVAFRQSLEPHVWAGYQHNAAVYGIATAAAQDPADAERIRAVQPLFEKLDEAVLHAYVHSDTRIGERLGVSGLDESLLRALAQFHLEQFERRRNEERLGRDHDTSIWANRIGWATVGAAVVGAGATVLAALL
jgi:hypothetical protein